MYIWYVPTEQVDVAVLVFGTYSVLISAGTLANLTEVLRGRPQAFQTNAMIVSG